MAVQDLDAELDESPVVAVLDLVLELDAASGAVLDGDRDAELGAAQELGEGAVLARDEGAVLDNLGADVDAGGTRADAVSPANVRAAEPLGPRAHCTTLDLRTCHQTYSAP